jgi:hypothetical protein
MSKLLLWVSCVFVFAFGATLWGQSGARTLSGKITSADGTGISNAAVTITNVNNNTSQKVLTAADGTFTISGLAPGTYRLDVETAGYKRTTQQNIILQATGATPVNITLERGNINETVEIKGHSPSIQSQSGEVSVGLGVRLVRELPLIERNYQRLADLQTGITPPVTAYDMVRDPARNRFFSADGQSPQVNEWKQDALYNTEPFRGTAIRIAPVQAIQEVDIETNSQTVNRGFNGAAVITDLTATGTNGVHGSLFEFNSGDWMRTRSFFEVVPTVPQPRFVYNQMGATIGGPIVRDKTFFFGSYEGTYQNGDIGELSTVPTTGILGGNFSAIPGLTLYNPSTGTATGTGRAAFPGNVIPASLLNPTAVAIASALPAPNLPGLADNYLSDVPFRNHANKADVRIDQHFSDRAAAFLRYGYTDFHANQSSPLGPLVGDTGVGALVAQNAVADFAYDVSANLIGDVRLGYNRYDQHLGAYNTGQFGNNLMGINIPGLPLIGAAPYYPSHPVDNELNGVLSIGYHTSRNDFRFGTDERAIRSDGFTDTAFGNMFGPTGTAYFGPGATLLNNGAPLSMYATTYNSLAAFLMGSPSQIGATNYFVTPTIRQTEYSVWAGDKIQFHRRFTLDLGVRYELFSPLSSMHTGGAAFYNSSNNTFNYAGVGGAYSNSGFWDTDNIAPRFGLAARITNKTVFRGGYAWNYFQLPYAYTGFTAPTYGTVLGYQGGYGTAPLTTPFGSTFATGAAPATLQNGASAGNLPAIVAPRYNDTAYIQNYSAQIQQDFYWGTMLSVGYMGSTGRHLPFYQELNTTVPGSSVTALPFYALGRTASTLEYSNGLTDNYNSLQASLSKRFSGGLSFQAAYTWSKALGYTTGNNLLLNPFNRSLDYGPMDYDRQSVLTISHVWALPGGQHGNHLVGTLLGGWQINGIFTWATGTPLTPIADNLTCGCINGAVLASMVPGSSPVLGQGINYLNPAAFTTPAAGTFGNLGRGAIRGPGFRNYNFSLFKNFHVHDRYNVELRGEAYNLTNSPHLFAPVNNINAPDFGQTYSTLNGDFGRQVNVALRITF